MKQLQWLGVVRHGESTGNVLAQDSEAGGLEEIDIPQRDADVPLSEVGREQAAAVGRWVAGRTSADRPELAVVSSYRRARETAGIALAGTGIPIVVDERLRDRELGVLDLLTSHGVDVRLPDEAARRRWLGKFYYRPPGGEAWTDVLLRLRALLLELRLEHPGGRVLWFAHEATVLHVRYLAEGLDEQQLMAIAHDVRIANCSISSWRWTDGLVRPELFNDVSHLHDEQAPSTIQEDVRAERT